GQPVQFDPPVPDVNRIKKYTVFFILNILMLILFTAVQFWLKPPPLVYGLNLIDLLMLLYLLGFFFFAFIFPRGETNLAKVQKNLLFLILVTTFLVPICFVELVKDVVSRLRLKGNGAEENINKVDSILLRAFNRVWYFFFKEKRDNLKDKNPHTFVSLNRMVYDLPFFGLLFMGVVLLLAFLAIKLGDNPMTDEYDGVVIRFIEDISTHLVPSGDHVFWFLLTVVWIAIFFTGLINNTMVVLIMFPLVLQMTSSLPFSPLFAVLALGIGASGAFMTPLATPVNAIAFAGFKGVSLKKMIWLGILLNLLCGLWVTCCFYFLGSFSP
ncbi:MAG: hypothetical protein GY940_47775, partial [bacterium]|nr:hypothetical protein [bacterium]